MNRNERQRLSVRRWIDAGGRATVVGCTGYGNIWSFKNLFVYLHITYI